MSDKGDWYCRNCGYLDGSRVTNSETCDECHIPVEWHSVDDISSLKEAQARIADLENRLASGIHTCNDHCPRPMCVARRRIRELEDALRYLADPAKYDKTVTSYAQAALLQEGEV